MGDKTAQSLNQAIKESFANIEFLKTFTFDNGLEFAGHEELTKILGVQCYFANPYHSWERGLNEHTNRLLIPNCNQSPTIIHSNPAID